MISFNPLIEWCEITLCRGEIFCIIHLFNIGHLKSSEEYIYIYIEREREKNICALIIVYMHDAFISQFPEKQSYRYSRNVEKKKIHV